MTRRIGGDGGGSDPGSGKGGGVVVVAAVLATAVAAAGSGVGGTSIIGSPAGRTVGTTTGKNISAKKADAKKAAGRGDADEAWRRLGMRTLQKAVKQDLECVVNSFGQVREFFARTPCKSLDRVLFGIGDDQGNSVVVTVAWVGFYTRGDARGFKRLADVHGTGNVIPLASTLLGLTDISFTGHHYQSRPDGKTIVIAEAEPATGHVSDEVLDAIADVAVLLPRL